MARFYYIGPWLDLVDGETGEAYRGSPDGTLGLVDLAPLTGSSYVFRTFDTPALDGDSDHIRIGDGTRLDEYYPTAAERSAWDSALGVTANPVGTLLDWLWDVLTVDADPEGLLRCTGIIPTHRGAMELHLGGHSLVRSRRWADMDNMTRSKVLHRVSNDYDRIVAKAVAEADAIRALKDDDKRLAIDTGGKLSKGDIKALLAAQAEEHPLKYLGAMVRKYKVQPDAIVKRELREQWGTARKPTTTLTDDFERSSLGANWTDVHSNISISSSGWAEGSHPSYGRAYYNTSLSSDDMKVECDVDYDIRGGAAARSDAGNSGYQYLGSNYNGTPMVVRRNGSWIGQGRSHGSSSGTDVWVQADGSSISVGMSTTTDRTVTDGNPITGVSSAGFVLNVGRRVDNWSAEDLVAAGDAIAAVLSGAGGLAADIRGVGSMDTTLSAQGGLSGDVRGVGSMQAALSGQGGLAAALVGRGVLVAALPATGALSPVLRGVASLNAQVQVSAELEAALRAAGAGSPISVVMGSEAELAGLLLDGAADPVRREFVKRHPSGVVYVGRVYD